MTTPKHPAINAFQNVDLAFCRIFAKQDQLETRIHERGGNLYIAPDLPHTAGERIAGDVWLDLARIEMETRDGRE